MTQTIAKHIGEGFGKGELYAALAYDATDAFGGMKIKALMLNSTGRISFLDANAYIYSSATTVLDLVATTINITGSTLTSFTAPISIGSTTTPQTLVAGTYPLSISGDVGTTLTSGALSSQIVETGILTAKNITGTGQVFGILSQLTVEGTSTISTAGCITAIGAYYITGGTTTASGGIHSAMMASMYAQAGFTVSASGIYCGLAVLDMTHTTACTNNDDSMVGGIFIANQAGTTLPNALLIGNGVTNFARFPEGALASATAASPLSDIQGTASAGFITVKVAGNTKYIALYNAN